MIDFHRFRRAAFTRLRPAHRFLLPSICRAWAWFALLPILALPASGQLAISEFMANNDTTLTDEDGDYSDWIEIVNHGGEPVDLAGWCLTDDAGDLNQWVFPSTNLSAGAYLVVFASGKDRRTPGHELHTNFALSTNGEYLALVMPDQTTAATEFAPQFPPQLPDVAYGLGRLLTETTLVSTSAPVRVHVPADGGLGANWTDVGFNDAGWTAGVNGIGYDTGVEDPDEASYQANMLALEPVLYWRLDETGGNTAQNLGNLGASGDGAYLGDPDLGEPGPTGARLGTGNLSPVFDGIDDAVAGPAGLLSGRGAVTMMGWIRPAAQPGNRIGLFGQNDAIEFGFMSTFFGAELQLWTPQSQTLAAAYPYAWGEWHHVAVVLSGERTAIYLDGELAAEAFQSVPNYGSSSFGFNAAGAGIWDPEGNFFHGQVDEVAVWHRALSEQEIQGLVAGGGGVEVDFSPYIATDVQAAMHGQNASLYARIPFTVDEPPDRLTLHIRYDDGFVAYLNGLEVAEANAPFPAAWDSAATARRDDTMAIVPQAFNLTAMVGALTLGENVLAIHGLNIAATNVDFLVEAELVAGAYGGETATPRYLLTPTPGSDNGAGSEDLGPIIQAVGHSPQVPADADDLVVTARVVAALSPVASVTAHYAVMFGNLVALPLRDDGTGGDAAAGDGVWSGTIPAEAAGPAEMIRYYVEAEDTDGRPSRWPLFPDPLDTEEFLGTVVHDPSIESALPVIHTFVDTLLGNPDSDAGAFASFFYNGEFYDRVHISLHGQSSRGWPKKSYNLDFTSDHRFDPGMGLDRVKDLKFLSNYGDKSKTHNVLAYEMMAVSGSVAHFAFHARVQRNGSFYSITDVLEDADDRWLERIGRDPNGALYKMYNNLGGAGGAEKKTRRWEGSSDLSAFIAGLDPNAPLDSRARYAFDNIDIPQTISYFVACALTSHQDHGHKNYYVYRDSDKTGEWAIFPQDVDLTWGRNWLDSAGYFTDTLFQDNVLDFYNAAQQGKPDNRLYELFFEHPQFETMYLRRLRTVMDTLLRAPGTPPEQLPIEARIREMQDLLDPPGVAYSDADRDYDNWPKWGNQNAMRAESDRMISIHLPGRRQFLFNQNPVVRNQSIPTAQFAAPPVEVAFLDVTPVSGIQDQEFVALRNTAGYAVDVSGWELRDAVEFTFRPGTVIPSGGLLYVSPNPAAFRQRTVSPKASEGRFVTGPYRGALNAWGETVRLVTDAGIVIDTYAFTGVVSDAQRDLRITEIMYNPPADGDPLLAQSFEFLELRNIGATTLDLTGVRLTDGIAFDFTGSGVTSLAPGAYVVVVQDLAAFESRYGSGLPVAGVYSGLLSNGGETLRLDDARGEKILEFAYKDGWQPLTDGMGFSLVVVDEEAPWNAWGDAEQWRSSGVRLGTPGTADPGPLALPGVLVNEALTHTDPPLVDAIELVNPETNPADISGWFLTDDFDEPKKFAIPAGTVLDTGGYHVFDEGDFNNGGATSFGLSATGEEVYLFSADAQGNLTGYFHGFRFGAAANGVSFGRYLTSTGEEHFVPQSANTLGDPNAAPRVGPVVISEVMYHPPNLDGANNVRDEYIELANITASQVMLYDLAYPTNTWRLRNAVDFDFPGGVAIPAHGRILVVGFDPAETAVLDTFRAAYNLDDAVPLYGPWSGRLDNAGETIELKRPDNPDTDMVPYIQMEQVAYDDEDPWPAAPDGEGPSLQRVNDSAYGDDPANWFAAPPTPGFLNAPNLAPTVALTAPADGAILELPGGILLTAEAHDPDGAILRVEFRADGAVLHTDTTPPYSFTWANPPPGTHALDARAIDDRLATTVSAPRQLHVLSQPPTVDWIAPSGHAVVGVGVPLLFEVDAADPDGAVVQAELFGNGETLGVDLAAPWQWAGSLDTAGLYDFTAVVTDNSGRTATSAVRRLQAVPVSVTTQTFVTAGSVWRYRDTGADPGTDWMDPAYDDSTWSSGPARLGYGVGGEATVVSYGPNANNKYIATHFRHAFEADALGGAVDATLQLKRDDGAVVYLNGTEILRVNMPTGPITHQTQANTTVTGGNNNTWFEYPVSLAALQPGANLLAVSIHQASATSSDISFDLALTAELAILEIPADSDEDGLPDAWETIHGLDPFNGEGDDGPDGDPDLDGMSNYQEWIAGTHPNDPTSLLALQSVTPDAATHSIIFTYTAAGNRTTRLEQSSTFDALAWSIVHAVTNPPADSLISVTNSTGNAEILFFRLSVPGMSSEF